MPANMLNTKEVAEYLGIHEKQVYALIKENKIPCTRVTGKCIFTKDLIDEWIAKHKIPARDWDFQNKKPKGKKE